LMSPHPLPLSRKWERASVARPRPMPVSVQMPIGRREQMPGSPPGP
jgi:hypothetical protein